MILVIGAGVMGLLTARALLRKGAEVTLIEANTSGRPASWAGGGILSPLYPWRYPEAVLKLAEGAPEFYRHLQSELLHSVAVDIELETSGMLMLDVDELPEAQAWAEHYGHNIRVLEAAEIQRSWPQLIRDKQGLLLPDMAQVRNSRLLRALRLELKQNGILQSTDFPVERLVRQADQIVRVDGINGQSVMAKQVVLCAGPWTTGLLSTCGLQLPVSPVRGQMLAYRNPVPEQLRTMVLYQGRYLIPRRDGLLLVGSTIEETGFDAAVTNDAQMLLSRCARKIVPLLEGYKPLYHWAGLRPASPKGIPYLGQVLQNLWIGTGHFRNGLVQAPASADLLSDLVLGQSPKLDPEPYRPVVS